MVAVVVDASEYNEDVVADAGGPAALWRITVRTVNGQAIPIELEVTDSSQVSDLAEAVESNIGKMESKDECLCEVLGFEALV